MSIEDTLIRVEKQIQENFFHINKFKPSENLMLDQLLCQESQLFEVLLEEINFEGKY